MGDTSNAVDRAFILHSLEWASSEVDLSGLDDAALQAIHRWVEAQLRHYRRCHVPGTSYIKKERRRGGTNKMGWRWVVYAGALPDPPEVDVCLSQRDAKASRGSHHATYWVAFVRASPALPLPLCHFSP